METEADYAFLQDFGFNYPFREAWRAFGRYYLSNFEALPDVGGVFDQDVALMDDLETLTGLANFHIHRLSQQQRGAGDDNAPPPPPFESIAG